MIKRVLLALKTNNFYNSVIKRGFCKFFQRKFLVNGIIIYCVTLVMVLAYKYSPKDNIQFSFISEKSEILKITSYKDHNLTVRKYFELRKYWKTSNLGSYLFKIENNTFSKKDKTFVVLVWKYWKWLQTRHVHNYGPAVSGAKDILSECSVNNCIFTGETKRLYTADVVLVHIMHGLLPQVKRRHPKQLWVFLNDESPRNAFSMTRTPPSLKSWANVFNWSMTYRTNADVPVPYGRTVALKKPLKRNVTYEAIAEMIPNLQFKRSDVLVTILISNCGVPFRTQVLKELQRHIKIDIYGKCSRNYKHKCPGHFKADCVALDQYYFYLVLENSMCRQYITEKVFFNAYSKGAIPILVGPSLEDCKTLLPPNSFIHYDDYETYEELAAKINGIIQNIKEYFSYHLWRNHFKLLNEHGYFGTRSYHLCRLCEALNYNEQKAKSLSVEDLRFFLDSRMLCTTHDEREDVV